MTGTWCFPASSATRMGDVSSGYSLRSRRSNVESVTCSTGSSNKNGRNGIVPRLRCTHVRERAHVTQFRTMTHGGTRARRRELARGAHPRAEGNHCRTRMFWIPCFLMKRAVYLTMEWIVSDGSSIEATLWKTARFANLCPRQGCTVSQARPQVGTRATRPRDAETNRDRERDRAKRRDARQPDDLGDVVRREFARAPFRLPRLVHDVSDQVGPADSVRGRDRLRRDDGPERLADVARVREVPRRGDQDGPEPREVTCQYRTKETSRQRGRGGGGR